MIVLTRLNGHNITVNSDLIKYAEASPDTVLTLVTGEKLIVLETCEQVQQCCRDYRSEVLRHTWPDASIAFSAATAISLAAEVSQQEQ